MSDRNPSGIPSSGGQQRLARIDEILFAHVQRRNQGEEASDEELLRAHPELMPELKEQLQLLRELSDSPRRKDSTSGSLNIRCPNCRQTVSVSSDSSLTDVTCSGCGSRFSLDVPGAQGYGQSQRLGHFELISQVGAGSFGSVWKARDTELDRVVAVKIPRQGRLDADELEPFVREARAAAQLKHPNIVSVHEVGREEQTVYIVSDFVEGVTLAGWLTAQQPTFREAARLCEKIAKALEHAHRAGVIHRDLKPHNIMLDAAGEPHLMDFGLARRDAGEVTMTMDGRVLGTPAYMSPEQARGEAHQADRRTDVYSLGVILFELLTGDLPFRGNARMMLHQVLHEEPPTPCSLNSSIPRDLETICLKCLEKDPDRRFHTTQAVADELQRYLDGRPILARRITQSERAWRWCKRNPVPTVLSAAVAASLLIGAIVAMWQAGVARKESRTALRNEYAATMQVIQSEWDQGQIEHVRTLLEKTRNYEDRQFEWYYWQWKTHPQIRTLRAHQGPVYGVAYSPKGDRIISGVRDGVAIIWDTATGNHVGTLRGHGSWVHDVYFSNDGTRILTSSWDHTVKVWDARTYEELLTLKGVHTQEIRSAAFSRDGRQIVTGGGDGIVAVWDATTGDNKFTIELKGGVWSVDFSPDGQWIVTTSDDKTATVWNAANKEKRCVLKGHQRGVNAVAYGPYGRRIVTGSEDGTAKIWDAESGEELLNLPGHPASVDCVAYSPNGKYIATGCYDGTVRIWDAGNGQRLHTLIGHDDRIWAVAFAPDSRHVATAGGWVDETVKIWKVDNEYEPLTLDGHDSGVKSLSFSGDGRWLVTGGFDQLAIVWDADKVKRLGPLSGHGGWVGAAVFSPNGRRIVTASWDHTAKVWDAESRTPLVTFQEHQAWVSSAAWSPNGQRIVTGSGDRTAKVWDASSGKRLNDLVGHTEAIFAVAYSPLGNSIVTGSGDGTAMVWDALGGDNLTTLRGHSAPIKCVAYSPDGERIVTGSEDATCKVWDVTSGDELFELIGHSGTVTSVTYSSDGSRIITGSDDGSVRVWDAVGGGELLRLTEPGQNVVESVAISPDGQRIAGGGRDVKVWRAASPSEVANWERNRDASERVMAEIIREQAAVARGFRDLRRRDPGAIRDWLLLAPITFDTEHLESYSDRCEEARVAFGRQQISPEANLEPTAGQRIPLAQGELVWRKVPLDDYRIDFNLLVGRMTNWAIAYAVCYIYSDTEQTDLVMHVGSDDQSKVYLNGVEVYCWPKLSTYAVDHHRVENLRLKKGRNVVVFKVMNNDNQWEGSLRFADRHGKPLKGIRVTLDPADGKP